MSTDSSAEKVLMVNPADVNLADVKAHAAKHGATVIASAYMPRGAVFLTRADDHHFLPLEEAPDA